MNASRGIDVLPFDLLGLLGGDSAAEGAIAGVLVLLLGDPILDANLSLARTLLQMHKT